MENTMSNGKKVNDGKDDKRVLRSLQSTTATPGHPQPYFENVDDGWTARYLFAPPTYGSSKYRSAKTQQYSGTRGRLSLPPLSSIENLEMKSLMPSRMHDMPVKVDEEVLVMDDIQMRPMLRGKSRRSSSSSSSSSSKSKSAFKTQICRAWEESGNCLYNSKCQYGHGREELLLNRLTLKSKFEAQTGKLSTRPGPCIYGSNSRIVAASESEVGVIKSQPASPESHHHSLPISSTPPMTGFIAMELNSQHRPFSIKLWPPSQNTRQRLVERLTNNLVTKSIFTKKYGTLDQEEAEENAKIIEDAAFATADQYYEKEPDGDGSSAVQLYAKECSKLLVDVLKVMKIFSTALEGSVLKYLNISDNALGEKGVRAFGALLKSQSCLEELYLMNDGISEEAAQAVSELIPSTEKLKVLHFHNNMTGDEGALAIAEVVKRSPSLEDFRCSSTRIGSEGGVALSEALGNCINLRKLDLRDNMLGVEGGVSLSKVVAKHAELREIYLSYLNLEDEGTIALVDSLKESTPQLEVIEMSGNEITVDAAPAIAAFLAVCNVS